MTELHGFRLVEERNITEINSIAKLYQHISSKFNEWNKKYVLK